MSDNPPPDEAFHLTGDRLGKFMVLSELGRGSMGVVYEAFQEDLKRKVALKILPANITLDAKQVRRFHREAESVARLRHDNVIQIYEVGQIDTTHYFAMELVDGKPLDPEQPRDREAVLRAARIARDAARGLAHAHERGVIHRDVKPGNLLVDRGGRVVVTDFGLARLTDSASLTSTDAIVGTPKYMSPEQILAHAQRPVDGRTDVYSLGATLYHVVAGRPPFDAPTVQGFIKAILEERPPSPRRFNRHIPHDLATIIRRCLEKNPGDRYASATELADDLDRLLAGERILAKPKGTLALAAEGIRRHRVIAATSAVAVIAVFLMLVLGGRAAESSRQAELSRILANGDYDAAVSDIEGFCARYPDDAAARRARATIYRNRAMELVNRALFDDAIKDLEKAGEQGSFWYLTALIETGRLDEAAAEAEALPKDRPGRALALARVAAAQGRYADAIGLLEGPVPPPESDEASVLRALTLGPAHRAIGHGAEALRCFKEANDRAAGIGMPWLRSRATAAFLEGGGDVSDLLASLNRTGAEVLRVFNVFKDRLASAEIPVAQHLVDGVLRIAKQPPVPPTTLEAIAQKRLEGAEGEERAIALLLLAIARLNMDKRGPALAALDEAEPIAAPEIEPYVYWTRALALRLQGNVSQAVQSAQQAIELALARADDFPDLRYLCEHVALLAQDAPEDQAKRTSRFLREQLEAMPEGVEWVNALLQRLSVSEAPPR
ncbi:MAG TPA: serine/threonine-protein kinase [Planctomycetota bacterium]|nr:serine/threonine-protein kinase [Planctomycetota bacterium]